MATDEHDGNGPQEQAAASTFGLADSLKRSFAKYVAENDVKPGDEQAPLNLDLDFVRYHGGPLLAHMLRDLTASIVPKDLSFSVPPKDAEGEAPATPGIAVNFDFADFLGKLFKPPEEPDER